MKNSSLILAAIALLLVVGLSSSVAGAVSFRAEITDTQLVSGLDCNYSGGEFAINIDKGAGGVVESADSTYEISISGRDLNAFATGTLQPTKLGLADDGNGTVSSDIVTSNEDGFAQVLVTMPGENICLGACDLNVGSRDENFSVIIPIHVFPNATINEICHASNTGVCSSIIDITDVNTSLCNISNYNSSLFRITHPNGHYVEWTSLDINGHGGLNIDGNVVFVDTDTELSVSVNTNGGGSGFQTLNEPATIKFSLIDANAGIQRWSTGVAIEFHPDGQELWQPCPSTICFDAQRIGDAIEFKVTGFSAYRISPSTTTAGGGDRRITLPGVGDVGGIVGNTNPLLFVLAILLLVFLFLRMK